MLELDGLSVQRGHQPILHDISLNLSAGQFVVILGENGAGKSTLLRSIAGDLAYQGRLRLLGRGLDQWSASELAAVRAVMEQQVQPPPLMSVQELVALGRYACHESEQQSMDVARRWIEALRLTALAHREAASLSGGEQQRTQLARSLAQLDEPASEPKLLLLDEPTAALDLYHQHHCLQLARRMAEKGHLVLAVMHDVNLASLYADRVLLLKDGVIHSQGSPAQVLNRQQLEYVYGTRMYVHTHPDWQVPMVFSEPHGRSESAPLL